MDGWGKDYGTKEAHIVYHDKNYYLVIVDEKLKLEDIDKLYKPGGDTVHYIYNYQSIDYRNIPRKFIYSKGNRFAPSVERYNLPIEDVIEVYNNKYYRTEYEEKNPKIYKNH